MLAPIAQQMLVLILCVLHAERAHPCRYALLAGAAMSQGLTMGPLIGATLAVHPGLLLTALLATSAVFACFSGAAILSKRRSWLYLSGAPQAM